MVGHGWPEAGQKAAWPKVRRKAATCRPRGVNQSSKSRPEVGPKSSNRNKQQVAKLAKETKDPVTTINETIQTTSEVIKRLPEFPEIMDKANQALTYLASGQIPQNSNSYTALNTKKMEMISFRNQSIIGLLVLVIFGLLVF